MRWSTGWPRAGIGVLACILILGAGCAREPGTATPAQLKAEQRRIKAADAWMKTGAYHPLSPELRQKLTQAVDNLNALTSYQLGLYLLDHDQVLQFDGEVSGGNVHLDLRRSLQGDPWTFYLIGNHFYGQAENALADYGKDSRPRGEKIYLPLYRDMRGSFMQALKGEVKDLGPAELEGVKVRKYDLMALIPGQGDPVLTVTLEVDEARGLLLHAILGNGIGSDSSARRFQTAYREIRVGRIGAVPPVRLPEGVVVEPVVAKDEGGEIDSIMGEEYP